MIFFIKSFPSYSVKSQITNRQMRKLRIIEKIEETYRIRIFSKVIFYFSYPSAISQSILEKFIFNFNWARHIYSLYPVNLFIMKYNFWFPKILSKYHKRLCPNFQFKKHLNFLQVISGCKSRGLVLPLSWAGKRLPFSSFSKFYNLY